MSVVIFVLDYLNFSAFSFSCLIPGRGLSLTLKKTRARTQSCISIMLSSKCNVNIKESILNMLSDQTYS